MENTNTDDHTDRRQCLFLQPNRLHILHHSDPLAVPALPLQVFQLPMVCHSKFGSHELLFRYLLILFYQSQFQFINRFLEVVVTLATGFAAFPLVLVAKQLLMLL